MLSLGARDAHGCLVHLVIVLSSALFFLRLCGGVALVSVVDLVAYRTIREVLQTP